MTSAPADHTESAPVPPIIGGRYRIVRLLGDGGMGAVYEAEHLFSGKRVAVKLLRRELARNTHVVQRFLQEARTSARLVHANVVRVLDMGEDTAAGTLFIVQEYLTGVDLATRLAQVGSLPLRGALAVIEPIMDALIAAHARGIVHRDIKPENIFLARGPSGEATPTLIDFGIAKIIEAGGEAPPRLTRPGAPVGTPYYMAPEQVRGEAIDGRADVWAIGAVLYEMLAGRRPFDGENFHVVVQSILVDEPPRLETLAPHVPAALAAAIHRALSRDPAARYASMAEFLAAVRAHAPARPADRNGATTLPSFDTGAAPPPEGVRATTRHGEANAGRCEPDAQAAVSPGTLGPRRRRPVTIAAVVAAALVAVGAGVVLLPRHRARATTPVAAVVTAPRLEDPARVADTPVPLAPVSTPPQPASLEREPAAATARAESAAPRPTTSAPRDAGRRAARAVPRVAPARAPLRARPTLAAHTQPPDHRHRVPVE